MGRMGRKLSMTNMGGNVENGKNVENVENWKNVENGKNIKSVDNGEQEKENGWPRGCVPRTPRHAERVLVDTCVYIYIYI